MIHKAAIQFDGNNDEEVQDWLRDRGRLWDVRRQVVTPDGPTMVGADCWIEETDDGMGFQVFYVWTHEQWERNRFPSIIEQWRKEGKEGA